MGRSRRSSSSLSWRLPAVVIFLLLVSVLLFVMLHQQIGDHAGLSGISNHGSTDQRVLQTQKLPVGSDGSKPQQRNVIASEASPQAAVIAPQVTRQTAAIAAAETAAVGAKKTEVAAVAKAAVDRTAKPDPISWKKQMGKSCQNYVDGDPTSRSLDEAKIACIANPGCAAIECPTGEIIGCTMRAIANNVDYDPADCYEKVEVEEPSAPGSPSAKLHPAYNDMLNEYAFQAVTTQAGQRVNIILVRAPFRSPNEFELFEKYKDEVLFMGISSFEDFPLDAMNPFSGRFPPEKWTGMFPGFLHMMREPDVNKYFPPHVKTILMSQSDFSLPDYPERDYSVPRKYDFTLSGSDQDVHNDCVGWSSYAKNWSMVKEALGVMCGEPYHLTGVLVATKSKDGRVACTIPESCKGKMIQTTFLNQDEYFSYLQQSRFAFLPQVHDASPRVSTQALALDVPLLMNAHISGGWKYLNEKTGEFFHDIHDIRKSLDKILKGADIPNYYEPRKFVLTKYGNTNSGKRLFQFVKENFAHRVKLPKGTTMLLT